jgi:hypothetical protein
VIKRQQRPLQRGVPLDIQNGSDFTVATDNDCLSLLCSSVVTDVDDVIFRQSLLTSRADDAGAARR